MLNDPYFKTTCNIRPHSLGPVGGLKIEGPLYWRDRLQSQLFVWGLPYTILDPVVETQAYLIHSPKDSHTSLTRTDFFGSKYCTGAMNAFILPVTKGHLY